MVKKISALLLVLLLALSAVGCGGSAETAAPATETATAAPTEAPTAVPTEVPTAAPTEAPKAVASWEIVDEGIETEVNSIGSTWFKAWYLVENTGDLPLYLDTVDVDIETGSGQMVKKISMMSAYPQVLLPGETGAYFETGTLDGGTETDGLKLHGRIAPVEAKVECLRYEVEGTEVKADALFGTKLLGRVVNSTDADTERMIYIAVLCYDANGAFLGAMFTILTDTIPANDYAGFEMTPFGVDIPADAIAQTVVFAYPNQFQF